MALESLLSQTKELEKRYKESKQKLRILFEITRLVSSYLHLENVLYGIIELLTKEYKFDLCAILLLERDKKVNKCVGLKDDLVKRIQSRTIEDPYTKECIRTKKIVIVNSIEKEVKKENQVKLLVPKCMKSFALTPITVENNVTGLLITASRKEHYFHIRYSDAIYIVANEIGIAIKIAQLYDEVYNSHKELEKKVRERTAQLEETHKKLLEAERHAAMGRMANRVAHELRNSLTVIGGFARRLNKKIAQDDPNKKYLDIIVKEVENLEKKVAKIIKLEPEE